MLRCFRPSTCSATATSGISKSMKGVADTCMSSALPVYLYGKTGLTKAESRSINSCPPYHISLRPLPNLVLRPRRIHLHHLEHAHQLRPYPLGLRQGNLTASSDRSLSSRRSAKPDVFDRMSSENNEPPRSCWCSKWRTLERVRMLKPG